MGAGTDAPVRRPAPEPPSTPAAEPPAWVQGTDAPVRRPAPEPPSTPAAEPPAWVQGTDAPVRRPAPEPPSTPAAEPPAWVQRTDAPVRRPAPEPPSTPAAEPPAWARPWSTPPAQPPRRNRHGARRARRGDSATASPASDQPTYEITWQGQGETGVFELRPMAPDPGADTGNGQRTDDQHRLGPSVQSAAFPWAWQMHPAPIPEARQAHQELVERLLAQGWERMGMGESWFAHRLRAPATPAASDGPPAGAPAATGARQT